MEYEKLIEPVAITNRLISIWPLDSHDSLESRFRPIHRVLMFTLATILGFAVLVDVIRLWENIEEVTECALISSAIYLSLIRLIVYTIHEEDLQYLVKTMRSDWLDSPMQDKLILQDRCLFAFNLARYFIITVALALITFMVGPILELKFLGLKERKFPFRGYFHPNQTSDPIFGYLYVFNALGGGLLGVTIMSATTINMILVIHASAKFAVVSNRLELLKSDDVDVTEKISLCIQRHQDAIFFAERVETTINILALCQFVISTGLVCFAGFQISAMLKDHSRLMKYVSFLNSAIFELFLFSYSGQQLIVESTAVGDSSYASDWVGARFTQNIQILMMRSLTPSKITAAKFYDMSLMSFTSVLSTSFSYFTVLQSVNEE
uniref:Odorant receptor n=1 Tax=Aulacocentrum confusum TaxID=2767324 RepID=A0A7G8Z971_9HYME|nr:olfactory receptor 52 [Aulacocentrum confusum]